MLVARRFLPRFTSFRPLSSVLGNAAVQEPGAENRRIRLVEGWKPPKLDFRVNIEVATAKDADLAYGFMITDSRTSEPTCVSSQIEANETPLVFKGINERSIDSGLTLLMFKEDGELIGIRMTSVAEMPKEPFTKEFVILPDYRELIDAQPSPGRKEKRITAMCEVMYEFGPKFIPHGVDRFFCLELIGIKKDYRCGNLATRFVQETFRLAASKGFQYVEALCTAKASQRVCSKLGLKTMLEMPYDKYLDNGEVCFGNTPDGSTSAQLMIGNLEEMGYPVRRH